MTETEKGHIIAITREINDSKCVGIIEMKPAPKGLETEDTSSLKIHCGYILAQLLYYKSKDIGDTQFTEKISKELDSRLRDDKVLGYVFCGLFILCIITDIIRIIVCK